jgi:SAM-dependent methyltransferase
MNSLRIIKNGLSNPSRVPGYILGKLFPNSKYGDNIKNIDDGVTFELGGFASAESRPLLLARHNYEMEYIQEYLSEDGFSKSLEIGCGYGRLSPIFAQFTESHFGIDINEDAIELAQKHYPEIDFTTQNAANLDFEDDVFDLVTTWTVLQHISPDQIEIAVEEIKRVLKNGGSLLICEATRYPNQSGGHTWDRTVKEYENILSPLKLRKDSYIDEIDELPKMETPGRVMLFEKDI